MESRVSFILFLTWIVSGESFTINADDTFLSPPPPEICQDRRSCCEYLKRFGLCRSDYTRKFMTQNCRKTCHFCSPLSTKAPTTTTAPTTITTTTIPPPLPPTMSISDVVCEDTSIHCMQYKMDGDCDHSQGTERKWMFHNCKKTCRYCDGGVYISPPTQCRDLHKTCPSVARRGDCDSSFKPAQYWATENCQLSCNLCPPSLETKECPRYMGEQRVEMGPHQTKNGVYNGYGILLQDVKSRCNGTVTSVRYWRQNKHTSAYLGIWRPQNQTSYARRTITSLKYVGSVLLSGKPTLGVHTEHTSNPKVKVQEDDIFSVHHSRNIRRGTAAVGNAKRGINVGRAFIFRKREENLTPGQTYNLKGGSISAMFGIQVEVECHPCPQEYGE